MRPEIRAACEPYAVAVRHQGGHPVLLCRAPPVAPDVLLVLRKNGAPHHAWHLYCSKAAEALLPHSESSRHKPPDQLRCPFSLLPLVPVPSHAAVQEAVGANVQLAVLYSWLSGVYRSFARLPAARYAEAVGGSVTAVAVSPSSLMSHAPERVGFAVSTRQEVLRAPLGAFLPAEDEVLVQMTVVDGGACLCEVGVVMPTCLAGSTCPDFAPDRTPMRCGFCGEHPPSKTCAGCHLGWWCSRRCQLAAWPAHKKACKAARLVQPLL